MILYLVRHGEAQLNTLGILHSRNYDDNPLTDRGKLEAAAAALFLHRMGAGGLYLPRHYCAHARLPTVLTVITGLMIG